MRTTTQDHRDQKDTTRERAGPSLLSIGAWVVAIAVAFAVGSTWGGAIRDRLSDLLRSVFPADDDRGEEATSNGSGFYTCGMHPWVVLPRRGICPICQMDLTPLDPDKFTGEIAIDPVVVQNIGVRVEPVTEGPLTRSIRTVGSVTYDETAIRDVHVKVRGWIEKLYVDYVGAEVEKGQPLFELYSPELYDTQSQYLLAHRSRDRERVPFVPETGSDTERLLESSRLRLEFYDITDEQIAALEKEGEPRKTLAIRSPHRGVVTVKHANEGMLVDSGMLTYRIADLSKVWVMVTLYEHQLPYVAVGQEVVMTLPYLPGHSFEGTTAYIYPFLDERTREVQVRLVFDNPDRLLKPGMFANVEIRSTLARERTLAPRTAVIDTGVRQVAFVSLGDGRFDPRDVTVGAETEGGLVEIVDGLKPGELVVTSGQFLLDSESRIRESLAKMVRGELASEQEARVEVDGVSELAELPEPMARELAEILDAYLSIGETLARDEVEGLAPPARRIAGSVARLLESEVPGHPEFWSRHEEVASVRGEALELAGANGIAEAREAYADLSGSLERLVRATGIPPAFGQEVQVLHCPMYREGQGGVTWLQGAGDVRNPYFGSTMLRCFDERKALPVTGGATGGETDPARDEADPATGEPDPAATATPAAPAAPAETEGEGESAEADPEPPPRPPEPLLPALRRALPGILTPYLEIGDRLAADSRTGLAAAVGRLAGEVETLPGGEAGDPPESSPARSALRSLRRATSAMAATRDLESAREAYADLSLAVLAIVEAAGGPPAGGMALSRVRCPMYREEDGGAWWIQSAEGPVRNPFWGSRMLRCHDVREVLTADGDGR